MEERKIVFFVKSENGNDFQSIDIKLDAVRSSNSPSLCAQMYTQTVRNLIDALQKLWAEAESAN